MYLTPADDVRIHCEQVHNFSFALVAPLRPEHHGHFVLRLLRDPERRILGDALPRPLNDRLPVHRRGLPSVQVSHVAVGCHAAFLLQQPGISFYRVCVRHGKCWSAASPAGGSVSSAARWDQVTTCCRCTCASSEFNPRLLKYTKSVLK